MKDWEIIADNLSKAGWSLGWVSALDSNGRTIWIVDAHRDESRFICADEKPFWNWKRYIRTSKSNGSVTFALRNSSGDSQNSIDIVHRRLADWRSR